MLTRQVRQRGDAEGRAVSLAHRYGVTMRAAVSAPVGIVVLLGEPLTLVRGVECLVLIGWNAIRFLDRTNSNRALVSVDVALALTVSLLQPITETAEHVLGQHTLSLAVCGVGVTTFVWSFELKGAAVVTVAMIASYGLAASAVPGVGAPWTLNIMYFLPVQAVVARWVYDSVLRAARDADTEAARRAAAAIDVEVAAAGRAAEREQWAVLHDTAATTLLMVGQGVPAELHSLVQKQAKRDLATLAGGLTDPYGTDDKDGDLLVELRRLATGSPLAVELSGPRACRLPVPIVVALTRATAELLTNVHRHARVPGVRIDVRATSGSVEAVVTDHGAGLRAGAEYGRGLRESVIGRMERIGGQASISGTPGGGTTATLRWQQR